VFDPEVVRELKLSSTHDISVGGGELASHAISAGLVDEYHLFVHPVIVGGGKRSLPQNIHEQLELLDEHRFTSGVIYLHYRTV
jgi:dihydrofolate reductase